MHNTDNLNIESFEALITPKQLKHTIPITKESYETVTQGRDEIKNVISGKRAFIM